MNIHGDGNLPDEIVQAAITNYQFSKSATEAEKQAIKRWSHAQDYGAFSVEATENEATVDCSLSVDDSVYARSIPKKHHEVTEELYPLGDVQFETVELMAIGLVGGFPWAHENFVAWYWTTPKIESLRGMVKNPEKWVREYRVFQQYFPPRDVTGTPTENTVLYDDDPLDSEFMITDVRNATKLKEPNPWAYAAMGVLYEDEQIAKRLFHHEDCWPDGETFSLSQPNS